MLNRTACGICILVLLLVAAGCTSSPVAGDDEPPAAVKGKASFDAGTDSPDTGKVSAPTIVHVAEPSKRVAIIAEAEKYIDRPYVRRPRAPRNFDCSSFVCYVYRRAVGMTLPNHSVDYRTIGVKIDFKDARPGDLVLFTSQPHGKRINHVAIIYKMSETGEMRGTWLIQAVSDPTYSSTIKGNPHTAGVKITELGKRNDHKWKREYFLARVAGVYRVLNEDGKGS
jgi:cell wall-associated NlpC family hydrolase